MRNVFELRNSIRKKRKELNKYGLFVDNTEFYEYITHKLNILIAKTGEHLYYTNKATADKLTNICYANSYVEGLNNMYLDSINNDLAELIKKKEQHKKLGGL